MNKLWPISRILKNNQIVCIQSDDAMLFVLVKQILHDVDDTEIWVKTPFGEWAGDTLVHSMHSIINHHQQRFLTVLRKIGQYLHKVDFVQQRLISGLPLAITPCDFSGNGGYRIEQ